MRKSTFTAYINIYINLPILHLALFHQLTGVALPGHRAPQGPTGCHRPASFQAQVAEESFQITGKPTEITRENMYFTRKLI